MNAASLNRMLGDFTRKTPGVVQAPVVSADGLRLATSPSVSDGLRDQLAAAASGMISLGRGTTRLLQTGPVPQTILDMVGGDFFVTAISQGAGLAVHADRPCDIGLVGYEMTMLASRVGHVLTPTGRATVNGRAR